MTPKGAGNIPRPPIVVVMGHVDHGKTTLLDFLRKSNVAEREAGGITQAVGAYEIEHKGSKITFIDTPGHEAFQAMRAAGAHIADLAILVVAAEDGVKPQTKEAVKILTESKTPFVVAINKIDKADANINKAKDDLTAAGILLEGYGGQISYHGISAKTGEGIDELLDLVLLATEVENLTYDAEKPATGFILETRVESARGVQATVIVKDGTMRQGDYIGTKTARGKIKILENFMGTPTKELIPSAPALIIGFDALPQIGEEFTTGPDEQAEPVPPAAEKRPTAPRRATPEDAPTLRLILKASDAGSLAALSGVMKTLTEATKPEIISESVGDITDGDVKSAVATKSVIVGFKNKVVTAAKNLAVAQHVIIVSGSIIYELIKEIENLLKAPEGPIYLGDLEILAVFNQIKLDKQVVGGKVTQGVFKNKARFDILRAEAIVGHGKVTNLQQQKKDADTVPAGKEAGIMANADVAIAVGDHLVINR